MKEGVPKGPDIPIPAPTGNSNTKWVALTILTVQNAALVLMMRYSRIYKPADELYLTSSSVVNAEIVKLVVATILCFIFDCESSFSMMKGKFKQITKIKS